MFSRQECFYIDSKSNKKNNRTDFPLIEKFHPPPLCAREADVPVQGSMAATLCVAKVDDRLQTKITRMQIFYRVV
jgi:hypothetical protein